MSGHLCDQVRMEVLLLSLCVVTTAPRSLQTGSPETCWLVDKPSHIHSARSPFWPNIQRSATESLLYQTEAHRLEHRYNHFSFLYYKLFTT